MAWNRLIVGLLLILIKSSRWSHRWVAWGGASTGCYVVIVPAWLAARGTHHLVLKRETHGRCFLFLLMAGLGSHAHAPRNEVVTAAVPGNPAGGGAYVQLLWSVSVGVL